jgi:hypothetical protein
LAGCWWRRITVHVGALLIAPRLNPSAGPNP